MGKIRRIILILLAAALLLGAILTWGSIGSAMLMVCLLIMAVALLYQYFVTRWDDSDYDIEGWN